MSSDKERRDTGQHLHKYLSPVAVWALSFGCAVGWGAFVMPGTTFLPAAGPLGTATGIAIGALVMLAVGMNYHYMIVRYPDAGGTLTYTVKTFGYDHGYLVSWFLLLVYLAIIWANASALPLIGRYLLGDLFQFGFSYNLLGYDVYFGEMLLSWAAIIIVGVICTYGKRISAGTQTILAIVLFAGILICTVAVVKGGDPVHLSADEHFAVNGKNVFDQVITIVCLSPWAFVGFESVSNSASGFNFNRRRIIYILAAALFTGALSYIMLTFMAVFAADGTGWREYIAGLSNMEGLSGLPTFYAAARAMGSKGIVILGCAASAAILTGLIGNSIAASRLMYSMSKRGMLPVWFGRLNHESTPENAFRFLMAVSMLIPFLGRTAIGWIVDVNTVGATIAYGFTSAAAFVNARRNQNRLICFSGIFGIAVSVFFFLYFMALSAGAMATESYLILAVWSILGFVYFRYIFKKDDKRKFGDSTVVWIGLLFLIFFTSLMWVKQATDDMTNTLVKNISEFYQSRNLGASLRVVEETENYISTQLVIADRVLVRNSVIQIGLIVISLGIMFSIYNTISQREKQMELEKMAAIEKNQTKSIFFANMSHDIRTPMNAIIGYTTLAEREGVDEAQMREYLAKIATSSQHLLALINDVLEMSRIESGKMEIENAPVNLKKTMNEIRDMFSTQMDEKKITYTVDSSALKDPYVMCDKNRLNRVLLNLLSNAYKFTPEYGDVSVTLTQKDDKDEAYGSYELRVKDSGIGMTKEFAERVFEAFERERNTTVSGIQGTGLGMAITKSIIDMMGGTIEVITAPQQGTEFVINLRFELQDREAVKKYEKREGSPGDEETYDFSSMRLLLTEDMEINREIATMILTSMGFEVESAINGQMAVEMVSEARPGYYDVVLMDVQMPVMDGYEATKAIRSLDNEELSRVPIIAMTANAFSEDVKKALDAGMDAHISKPVNVDKIKETLKEVLEKDRHKA